MTSCPPHLEVAVSHHPEPVAPAAEVGRHRRHEADVAAEPVDAEVLGDFAAPVLEPATHPQHEVQPGRRWLHGHTIRMSKTV